MNARNLVRRSVLIPAATLIAGVAIGAAAMGGQTTVIGPQAVKTVPGPTVTVTVPVPGPTITVISPPPKPTPIPVTFDGNAGTLAVKVDIRLGTYRATCEDELGCYWARLGSFDSSDINDNGNADQGQTAIVTIKPSDKAFQTEGFGEWVRVKR